jgi:hypothetical protein
MSSGIQYGGNIISEGLVFYVDAFKDINGVNEYNSTLPGSIWHDLSGNGGDIIISGAAYSTTNNGYFLFNPAGKTGIGNSNAPDVGVGGDVTIEIWVNVVGSLGGSGGEDRALFQYGSSNNIATAGCSYWVGLDALSAGTSYRIVVGSGSVVSATSTTPPNNSLQPPINSWQCITWTLGSSGKIIRNANFTTTNFTASHNVVPIASSGNRILIGRISGGIPLSLINTQIGSIKVWNRILSETEILESYNTTKGRYGL